MGDRLPRPHSRDVPALKAAAFVARSRLRPQEFSHFMGAFNSGRGVVSQQVSTSHLPTWSSSWRVDEMRANGQIPSKMSHGYRQCC